MSEDFFKNEKFFPADTLSVGIDIGKTTCWFCAVTARGEQKSRAMKFSNSLEGFEFLIEKLGELLRQVDLKDLIIGMESSGSSWRPLFEYLLENGLRAVLVNSYLVNRRRHVKDNSPRKNDRKDAFTIAGMVSEGECLMKSNISDVTTHPLKINKKLRVFRKLKLSDAFKDTLEACPTNLIFMDTPIKNF